MTTLISQIKSSEWSISLEGFGEVVQGMNDINQCLQILLFTRKGEDPFRPEFGCGAMDFIDKPITVAIPGMIREIIAAVALYETRIDITSIVPSATAEGVVSFNISWKLTGTVDTGQIDVTYGIG